MVLLSFGICLTVIVKGIDSEPLPLRFLETRARSSADRPYER